jgi:hypothetical protein
MNSTKIEKQNEKIDCLFATFKEKMQKEMSMIDEKTDSYEFEKKISEQIQIFSRDLYQTMCGEENVPKNSKMELLTSFGEIQLRKTHPLAVSPSGYKISAYLQAQMCRLGSKMVFDEASEELNLLKHIPCNAKQIERICHHYGDCIASTDLHKEYEKEIKSQDANISTTKSQEKDSTFYVMMDGSMILTRDKEQKYKELKLFRSFYSENRIERISKNRNMITESTYISHLGSHDRFLDKVLESLPKDTGPVFIADGAKWIWNFAETYFPENRQILDYFHCKEHLCEFAKDCFSDDEKDKRNKWVEDHMDLLKNEQVELFFEKLDKLETESNHVKLKKNKLLTYLLNNKKRINYGAFLKEGLLVGSGAMESANRDVIQKRLKLSGQRWTVKGANQIANLRTCYKSNKHGFVIFIIKNFKKTG